MWVSVREGAVQRLTKLAGEMPEEEVECFEKLLSFCRVSVRGGQRPIWNQVQELVAQNSGADQQKTAAETWQGGGGWSSNKGNAFL